MYHCCSSLESVPLLFAFSPDEGSFRFTFRAVFTYSGVGVTCIDGTAVFFKTSLGVNPANFAPTVTSKMFAADVNGTWRPTTWFSFGSHKSNPLSSDLLHQHWFCCKTSPHSTSQVVSFFADHSFAFDVDHYSPSHRYKVGVFRPFHTSKQQQFHDITPLTLTDLIAANFDMAILTVLIIMAYTRVT